MKNPSTVSRKNVRDILSLTPMQEGMLYHYLRAPAGGRYHERISLTLAGDIDIPRFENAWREVTAANEMLRTLFRWESVKKPLQMVLKQHEPKIHIHDLRRSGPGEKQRRLERIRETDRRTPFDLADAPFRVTLCLLDDDRHEMIIGNHHIIYDGWSTGIILQEFFEAYNRRGEKPSSKPEKPSFHEYIKWLNQQDKDAQARYWETYLSNGGDPDGGADNPVPAQGKKDIAAVGAYQLHIDAGRKQRLEAFALGRRVTLASVLYSAWGLLMQDYLSSPDIVFDTTVSGRSAGITAGIDHMVGLFINTVPLRIRTQTGDTPGMLVQRIARDLQQREAFESTSVAVIKEYMERANRAIRLFDSVLVLENYPLDKRLLREGRDGEGLRTLSFSAAGESSYDLTVLITVFDALDISITYNAELFDQELMEWLGRHFTLLLDAFIQSPEREISTLNPIPAAEKLQLIDRLKHRRAVESGAWRPPEFAAPRDDIEVALTEIWQEVLNRTPIGIDDNFFDFGGHSLKATLLSARIHQAFEKKIPIETFFLHPNIRELAQYLGRAEKTRYHSIPPAAESDHYPAASAQTRWYFLQRLEPGSTAYNGPLAIRLDGEMTPPRRLRLENTFNALIARHEILRTSFSEVEGRPVQVIHDPVTVTISAGSGGRGDVAEMLSAFVRPFDLSRAPLLRVELVPLNADGTSHLLLVDMHHIVTDGASLDIFIKEFNALYRGESLEPLKLRYKDFAQWQHQRIVSRQMERQESYWLKQLTRPLPVLNAPLDFPRPAVRRFEGDTVDFRLGEEHTALLTDFQRHTGATLFMVLLSAFYILLNRYADQDDIIIGAVTAGRDHADLQGMMGLLLETLALRNSPEPRKIYIDFLSTVKESVLNAFENRDYPFGELMKHFADDKDLSRNPVFDVMLNVRNMAATALELDDFIVTPVPFQSAVAKLDLTLEAVESAGDVHFTLEYDAALFRRETVERMSRHFINVLSDILRRGLQSHLTLGHIEMLDEAERRRLLETLNDTAHPYPEDALVTDLFRRQAERTPDGPAVVGDRSLSYRRLNQKSDQLASLLIQKGVRPDTIVGIMTEPSPEMMIGLLGILKAGGAYLPLDSEYPVQRLKYMLADSSVTILVSDESSQVSELSEGMDVISLDDPDNASKRFSTQHSTPNTQHSTPNTQHLSSLASAGTPGLAYVIYTSGSTGRPKGVAVEHRNLTAYIHSFYREFDLGPRDIVLQQASYAFDVFVEEVYPVLLRGGRIALPGRERVKDMDRLTAFIARHGVTMVDCSPLMLSRLNQQDPALLASVRIFISGGDVLEPGYIDNLLKIGAVYNTYGPTESTVCATYYRCLESPPAHIPIGRPIANYRVHVLDPEQRLLPVGVPGELCVAGPGVTRGYLNRPELIAEKFGGAAPSLNRSYKTHESDRIYRTGDRVKRLPDGDIAFLGRIDHQVKIRGYRIEPGEIESRLTAHPHIREAVVLPKDNPAGGKYLCAYIVVNPSRQTELTAPEIRAHLVEKLPEYMAPALFIPLERMPLTPTGKPDRSALPEPGDNLFHGGREYTPPGTAVEEALVKIWRELLPVDRVGVTDDFFELGGDSILVNRCIADIRETLHVDIPMRTFFEHPVIRLLAPSVSGREADVVSLKPMKRDGEIPLSYAQERLWFLQELDADNAAYFVPRVIRMTGPLDVTLLERTFSEIIRRHEVLRTVFPTVEGRPVQRVGEPYYFKIPTIDWSREKDSSSNVSHFIEEESRRVFDFENGPLLRVTVIKLEPEQHLLVLTEHHLIHDGWTQGVLLKEFITVFSALREGKRHGLPELPIQYADYALWQRENIQGEVLDRHLDYWKTKMAGLAPVLDLPFDRPRPPVISGEGGLNMLHLSPAFSRKLKAFSRGNGVTLYMTMLAAFKTFLYRYSGVEDLCVGAGIANRRYKEMEGMLGMVINTLPLRSQIAGDVTFSECLNRVKQTCLEAYQHEDTPFGKIVEALQPERNLNYMPLFQVMFSFMDTPGENLRLPGLELQLVDFHNRSAKFDINIVVVPPPEHDEDNEALAGETLVEWEYNTDIFDASTTERMVAHYKRILERVVETPGDRLAEIAMLSQEEIRELLYTFNDTGADYPEDKTIHQWFGEQATKSGEKIALAAHGAWNAEHGWKSMGTVSYVELNKRSDHLASMLMDKGVIPGDIVGVLLERSIEAIIGIMAVLKAGGAYLPIDTAYPVERIRYMLADSGTRILLTGGENQSSRVSELSEDIEIFHLDPLHKAPGDSLNLHSAPNTQHLSSSMAYIIYTSGTTGKPKGAVITHRSLVNLCTWHHRYYRLTRRDNVSQYAGFGFDASVWEIFPTLTAGAALYIISPELRLDIEALNRYFEAHRITVAFLPTPVCHQFMELDNRSLRVLLTGGDKLQSFIKRGYQLHNNYGPTESTVVTTSYRVEEACDNIPIGRPIANTRVYILSRDHLRLQPVGVAGELCIAGGGLSPGYLNNPELTSQKFVRGAAPPLSLTPYPLPLYTTGDLARRLPDGNIEFLGRIDQQVKVRGFRIELSEIENRLLAHPDIKEAVVIDRTDPHGTKYLCAYIVAHKQPALLKEFLSETLPGYMAPAHFVSVDRIPLTPNGKVDRTALPEPAGVETTAEYAAPRDDAEKQLVEIWADVLGVNAETLSTAGNFFELGGHSLNAVLVVSRMHKAFNVKMPLTEFFKRGCIREMREYLEEAAENIYETLKPAPVMTHYPQSTAQQRLFFLDRFENIGVSYNMPTAYDIEGPLDRDRLEEALNALVRRHEMLRTSFRMVDEVPVQIIHEPEDVVFRIDYYKTGADDIERVIRPFQLDRAPLFRIGCFNLSETRCIMLFDMHHIITDGASQKIFTRELLTLYSGRDTLAELPVQYKDYSCWLHSESVREEIKRQEVYWLNEFSGEIPALDLPVDSPRPAVRDFKGSAVTFKLDREETRRLNLLAGDCKVTTFMILLAAGNIFLHKLSSREDIVVGAPIAARRHPDLQNIIGMFVNTLAFRNAPRPGKTVRDFISEVGAKTLKAYENQEYPFEELVGHVVTERDTGRNPLFDVMMVSQNQFEQTDRLEVMEIAELTVSPYPCEKTTAKFDMLFHIHEDGEEINVNLEYAASLYKSQTIRRFIDYFKTVTSSVLREPGQLISAIEIISTREKEQILSEFNIPGAAAYEDKTVHRLFEEQVSQTPDNIAVAMTGAGRDRVSLSYRELNDRADRLAARLRQEGVGPDRVVGLMVPRSAEMISGVLAILKAGGAYMPIDPDYPRERIRYMLADSNAGIVLSGRENQLSMLSELSEEIDIINLDHPDKSPESSFTQHSTPNTQHLSSSLVYVIYTSGSTGKPKGVMLEHGNLVNLIRFQHRHTSIDFSRVLQFAAISFDVSFQEIFSTLTVGGSLFPIDTATRNNITQLFDTVARHHVTTLFLPTAFFKFLANDDHYVSLIPHCVRHIITAGEQLAVTAGFRDYLREHGVQLHNHYGPTESHVVTALTMAPGDHIPGLPSIGKPVVNTAVYIVDAGGHLQPPGVSGELIIGGLQVGRGYLNRPELTAEKFNRSYKSYGSYRTYRTGDLARWLPDGNIEFLGRIDYQVKIRGFRVELGEIENRLLETGLVNDAVVIDREEPGHQTYLCAYVVIPGRANSADLRTRLTKVLPDYMIPSYFVPVDRIPLTPNGKLDRRLLPKPEAPADQHHHAPPRNAIEKSMAEIWAAVLSVERGKMGIDTNFFEAGGHSLKAIVAVSRMQKQLDITVSLEDMFKYGAIRGLIEAITPASGESRSDIEPAGKKAWYRLSPPQKRLYILHKMTPGSTGYNMPQVVVSDEPIDPVRLEQAVEKLIQRHESLRTSFNIIHEEAVQKVHESVDAKIALHDLSDSPGRKRDIERTVRRFVRVFDLAEAPLFRVALIKAAGEKDILMLDLHHIITDGISQEILRGDLAALYSGETLSPLKLQYKDYAEWWNSESRRSVLKQQEDWWLKQYEGDIPILDLPVDFPRPPVQSFDGDRVSFVIEEKETRALKKLALQDGATLYMVLSAIFNVFLSKISGKDDIVIGSPAAGRRHDDLNGIIGMFVNTLALRNRPAGNLSFRDFLRNLRANTIQAFENQEYPFEELVERLSLDRDTGRNPLFDVVFSLLNIDSDTSQKERLDRMLKPYPYRSGVSKFDLTLACTESGERLSLVFEYCTRLFERGTIQRFINHIRKLISGVLAAPDTQLSQLEMLTQEERRKILNEFNHTRTDYPGDKTIHQLFKEQVSKSGRNVAVIDAARDIRLTYIQLNQKAHRLASELIHKGVVPGDIVAIMGDRSIDMAAGILGILKTGAAYLPIDIDYPEERKRYMLADSGAKILLSEPDGVSELSEGVEIVHLNEFHDESLLHAPGSMLHASQASGLAYIMYTSGSTGRPKGVMVTHRNVVRLVKNNRFVPLSTETCMLQTGAPVFDAVTFEMWGSLLNGGRLVLAAKEVIVDAPRLGRVLSEYKVNTLWLSASLFNQLSRQDIELFAPLLYLLVGGDVLSPSHINPVRERFPRLSIINGYGPTENTTFSTTHLIDKTYEHGVPIGRPISNSTAYIVDAAGSPQPVGVWGELWVGGDGVARGYLNNPELTADRFLKEIVNSQLSIVNDQLEKNLLPDPSLTPNPLSLIPRLYRTGDLARWTPEGLIEFKGRIDQQVKIRGFRIELEEIEQQLLNHEAVKETVVMAREDRRGDKHLAAYIVAAGVEKDETAISRLREFLSQTLPDYMIPSGFVFLDTMPLTPNGKIDRKALPEPGAAGTGEEHTVPRDDLEKQMVRVWADVLAVDTGSIGLDTSFFHLGGHSLKAAILASRIHKAFNVEISLREVLLTPTIRAMAGIIREREKTAFIEPERVENKEFYPLSFNQQRFYLLYRLAPESPAYNMPVQLPMEYDVDESVVRTVLETLTERHESLRTGFTTVGRDTVQTIAAAVNIPFRFVDISSLEEESKQRELDRLHREINGAPFDLETVPLFRAALIKSASRRYEFLFNIHHILCDGWSLDLLQKEFFMLYDGYAKGETVTLPPLPLRYRDFQHWHQQRLTPVTPHQKSPSAAYWEKRLAHGFPVVRLPYDFPESALETGRAGDREAGGAGYRFTIGEALKDRLLQLAENNGATLFSVMFSVYMILLNRLSGSEDVGCSVIIAGRAHASFRDVVGLFVNSILLQTRVDENEAFETYLRRVNRDVLEAFQYQDHPMESVFEALKMRFPEVPVSFNMLNMQDVTAGRPIDSFESFHIDQWQDVKFDVEPYITQYQNGIDIRWIYRKTLFTRGAVEQMTQRYLELLESFTRNPDRNLNAQRTENRPARTRRFKRN